MPRNLTTHTLAGRDGADYNDAHQQLNTTGGNTEQTLTLDSDCTALLLSARTGNAYVTFNNTTASSSNGIEILAGAQPVYIPIGFHAAPTGGLPTQGTVLRVIGSAASTILNVLQLA